MDHRHGGAPTSLPRAHRPRAPIMGAAVPLTAPLGPLRPPPPVVTLSAPRPETERAANEYVETPFRAAVPPSPPPAPPRPDRLDLPPVTKQPCGSSFAKHHHSARLGGVSSIECGGGSNNNPHLSSIMCPECGLCRCYSCQQPRPLPQRWVCGGTCLLSADAVVDYASCLCCVKGLFYHCSDTDETESCADEPCACAASKRSARWACLGALSCALPCLWLYWPLRGCKRAVEVCYAQHSRSGCRCRQPVPTPEKRLLDASSPDF